MQGSHFLLDFSGQLIFSCDLPVGQDMQQLSLQCNFCSYLYDFCYSSGRKLLSHVSLLTQSHPQQCKVSSGGNVAKVYSQNKLPLKNILFIFENIGPSQFLKTHQNVLVSTKKLFFCKYLGICASILSSQDMSLQLNFKSSVHISLGSFRSAKEMEYLQFGA